MTDPAKPPANPWSTYMLELYSSRKAPQPLGTVSFDQIEAMAKEKLKDYGGKIDEAMVHEMQLNIG
jgi:lactate 2-monooxygenase